VKLIADEHVPPAFVKALRGDGHDVTPIGDAVELGASDRGILDYARGHDCVIVSEDSDFRGADADLDIENHPGVFACDTTAKPGDIAAAVRQIERLSDDLTNTVVFVPNGWI
jgi:predicted nuclease of predicted toxin-antitoxin system